MWLVLIALFIVNKNRTNVVLWSSVVRNKQCLENSRVWSDVSNALVLIIGEYWILVRK
jgi:hypothetical protein